MTWGLNGTADAVCADTETTAAAHKVEGYKFDGTTLSNTAVGAVRAFESLIITKANGKKCTTREKGRRLGDCQ
jgi:hypothetical protein